ncbi:MAG: DUF4233 domain-containing protein [Dermatophilaceae bacterium]
MGFGSALRFTGTMGKFTWRMLAVVLVGQAISISLGAMVGRGIAMANDNPAADTYLWAGLSLAGLCLVAAALMRGPIGVPLGWLCQGLTLLSGLVVPLMLMVGLMFLALWVMCFVQGAKIERVMAQREAAAASG